VAASGVAGSGASLVVVFVTLEDDTDAYRDARLLPVVGSLINAGVD